jgi:glycosyltransferase involved in cell wall biosynthesis
MTMRVSIITATYNRANVLRYTIESVLRQTFTDWELLVVGDACTDDTSEAVRSFGDPRIRFVNLERNSGEQATPNNEGVRLARGELIAFLNHDDLWTPEHLAVCVAELDTTGTPFVSTAAIAVDHRDMPYLMGVGPRGTYEPQVFVPASSWVMRRDFAAAVGPWRPAREIFATPSQDWIFRAWRRHRPLYSIAKVTVLAVHSGGRQRSYADRLEEDNARYAALLRDDPDFIPRLMSAIALRMTAEGMRIGVLAPLIRAAKNAACRATIAAAIHPSSLVNAFKHRRKGGLLDFLRRNRGLPPLPRTGGSRV